MTQGFKSYTSTGITQISDDEEFFYLYSKTTLGTPTLQSSVNDAYSDYTFNKPAGSDFMLGIRSSAFTWYVVLSVSSTSISVRVSTKSATTPIVAYLFVTGPPPSTGFGLILQNAEGTRVFNSDYPVARVLGVFTDTGYTGLPYSGRTLAQVPMKEGVYSSYELLYSPRGSCNTPVGPGYLRSDRRRDAKTRVNTSTMTSQNSVKETSFIPINCSSTQGQSYTNVYDALEFRTLILDVTNI